MSIPILFPLLKKTLVNIVWCGEASLSLVETVLKVADIFLIWFLHIEFSTFATVDKLSFVLDLVVVGQFYPEAVLDSVQKLSIVYPVDVEIEEAFVGFIAGDGVTVVYAIFELFDGGGADDDIAGEAEIGEEVEDF